MRFNVRCDMEGATGITTYDQVFPGRARYGEGQAALMHDLLAVIAGIRDAAPEASIIVYDEHVDGRNVRVLELPERVHYVSGKPAYTAENPGFLHGCDGMLLVGFHARAGVPGALMPHTYEHEILDLVVNGRTLGEVGLEALIAAEAGVPTLFYGGDSAGAAEIRELIPDIVAVSVKEAVAADAAICYPGPETAASLREGAARAVRQRASIRPLPTASPVTFRVRLAAGPYREALQVEAPALFVDEEWVQIEAPSATAAYARYWEAKARARARIGR